MAINNLPSNLDRIIYDPVRGRVIYDFTITALSSSLLLGIFYIFEGSYINLTIPLLYSIIFMISNFGLGLYGRNKTGSLNKKMIILGASNLISFLILITLTNEFFLLTLFLVLNSVVTILPRFFLNFNVERTAYHILKTSTSKSNPILIVGGGGYIGSLLVEELLKKGEKVRVFDKFIYGTDVFKGIRNKKNLELFEGDISDVYSLTLAVKDTKAIVHLAGIVGDPAAKVDKNLTRHVNIASTRLLKETAKAFGVKKFIFASSCSVYGHSNSLLTEKSKPSPVSLYAQTKIDSEKELLSDTTDNFHPIVLRFATVFGDSRKPRFDLVANLFTAQAYFDKKIKVFNGNQWRPFIHVRDISFAIIKILDAPVDQVSRQIYNVGDDNLNYKIIEIADIVKMTSKNPKVKIIKTKKGNDKRNYKVSFKKIHTQLNFNSSITIEKGIKGVYLKLKNKKYKKSYLDANYINFEKTKELKKEFKSKKYKSSHFSTIS